MQSAHPADASLAGAAAALERRDFEVAANESGPLDADRLADADVLVIAHPSEPRWEATTGEGSPRLEAGEIEAIVSWVEGGGGLIVLGETEQEKYGNNLNELLARFGLEIESRTVQDYEHHREAPSWVLADLIHPSDPEGVVIDPAGRGRGGLLLPGRDARGDERRAGDRADLRLGGAAARAACRGRLLRRRAGRRARRLRPVRGRLHRGARPRGALGQPRLLGGRGGVRRRRGGRRLGSRRRPCLAAASRRGRGAAAAAGARRLGPRRGPRRRAAARAGRRDRRRRIRARSPLPAPGGLHRGARRRPRGLGRRRLRQARLPALGRGVPARAGAPRRGRASRRLPDVQAERLARHLLRGVDRAGAVAAVGGRARAPLRQREVRPGDARRLHLGLRLRVRGPLPGDVLGRGQGRRPISARSSATARRSGSAASAAPRPTSSGSTCRPTPPACSAPRSSHATPTSPGT